MKVKVHHLKDSWTMDNPTHGEVVIRRNPRLSKPSCLQWEYVAAKQQTSPQHSEEKR